jgi:iron only hydrogenase large subunit-like protein
MFEKNTLSLDSTVNLDKNKTITIEELKKVPDSFYKEFNVLGYLEYVNNPIDQLELIIKKIRKGGSLSISATDTIEFCTIIQDLLREQPRSVVENNIRAIKSIITLEELQSFFQDKGFDIKFAEYSRFTFLLKVEKR